MKTFYYLAFVFSFIITSCSDDETAVPMSPQVNDPILVTKIITMDYWDGEQVDEYIYDGPRISQITHNDGKHEELFYQDSRISSKKYYDGEVFLKEELFEYDPEGQLLKIRTFTASGNEYGHKYTYGSFGINIDNYIIDPLTLQELVTTTSVILNFENQNMTWTLGGDFMTTYSFDHKNNPFINVSDLNPLMKLTVVGCAGINNIVAYNPDYADPSTTTYTYNSEGFPVTSIETFESGYDRSRQYFYND